MKFGKSDILTKGWLFLGLLVLTLVLFPMFLMDFKKAQSLIVSEWSRCNYLIYLLKTKAPVPKKTLSPQEFERKLRSKGFEPEVVRSSESGGLEAKLKLSWEDLGQLLSWMSSQDIKVETFRVESISEEGIFEVRMRIR